MSPGSAPPSLWVRMQDWVPVEAEMPDPVAGSVLQGAGIRAYAALAPADPATDDGIVRCETSAGRSAQRVDIVEYLVTGSVTAASDFDGAGRRRRDTKHAGVDVVLAAGGTAIQVQTDGCARDVPLGTRMSVRGELLVIPFYCWDGLGLVDTRSDWAVEESLRLPDGDLLLRLETL